MPKTVLALVVSDLHLSEKAPPARAGEQDWYEAMKRSVVQLRKLANEHNCPIICAGDIFDKPNPSPQLINWAIDYLPLMYAVPGQHDLPLHRLEDIEASGYWTLVLAHVIRNVEVDTPSNCVVDGCNIAIHGFPWGVPIAPNKFRRNVKPSRGSDLEYIDIALIHKYIWRGVHCYPGAREEDRLDKIEPSLKGYNFVIIGDNHKSWSTTIGNTKVFNCGAFMRRKSDEFQHKPRIGCLMSDGSLEVVYLDTSEEVMSPVPQEVEERQCQDFEGVASFIDGLKASGPDSLDYRDLLRRAAEAQEASAGVLKLLAQALEHGHR